MITLFLHHPHGPTMPFVHISQTRMYNMCIVFLDTFFQALQRMCVLVHFSCKDLGVWCAREREREGERLRVRERSQLLLSFDGLVPVSGMRLRGVCTHAITCSCWCEWALIPVAHTISCFWLNGGACLVTWSRC